MNAYDNWFYKFVRVIELHLRVIELHLRVIELHLCVIELHLFTIEFYFSLLCDLGLPDIKKLDTHWICAYLVAPLSYTFSFTGNRYSVSCVSCVFLRFRVRFAFSIWSAFFSWIATALSS